MDKERLYLGCILGRAGTVIALREEKEGVYYVITTHTYKTMYDVYKIAEFQGDKAVANHIVVDTDYDTALKAYLQGGNYHD